MTPRIDITSRLIHASPSEIYRAFAQPGAMEQWLPPGDMTGEMLSFDFRPGGSYRMRLTYRDTGAGEGKTTADSDEVAVRLVDLEPGRRIVGEAEFESDDPAFAGTMRMTWTFEEVEGGTRVTVRAENVPEGIRPEDHQAGLNASLVNLTRFTEANRERGLIAHASLTINAPTAKVWEALVTPDMIRQYMFGTTVVTDWQEGSSIVWKGEWQGRAYEDKGTILRIDREHVLQYSHFSPLSGEPDVPEAYHTVTVTLSREGQQTHVMLSQDNNASEEARAHSEENWQAMLESLKALLEA